MKNLIGIKIIGRLRELRAQISHSGTLDTRIKDELLTARVTIADLNSVELKDPNISTIIDEIDYLLSLDENKLDQIPG